MTPDLSIQFFFRGCGAFGLFAACFGAAFPLSARIAFVVSFALLVSGDGLFESILRGGFDPAIMFQKIFPELALGAVAVLPACVACFTLILFARWSAQLVFPEGGGFFTAIDPSAKSMRLRSFTTAVFLLGAVSIVPYLPDVFLRLTESLFAFPSAGPLNPNSSIFSQGLVLASGRLALVAALGLALPLIAVSFAFDAAVLLAGKYLSPLRGDPALRSLRIFVVGAALAGSIYSLSQLVDNVTRENIAQKRVAGVLREAFAPGGAPAESKAGETKTGETKPGAPQGGP